MSDGKVYPAASGAVEHASSTGIRLALKLRHKKKGVLQRYGLALGLAALALLIRGALPVPIGTTIYQLPLAAVVLSGWLGGRGPGLLASLICTTGIVYWFVPPVNSFEMSPDYRLAVAIFVGLCLLLTEFGEARWRVKRALEESEARLRVRQEMLDLAQKAARAVAFDWYIGARESENHWSPELEAMYGLEPGTFDRTVRRLEEACPSRRLAVGKARHQACAGIG